MNADSKGRRGPRRTHAAEAHPKSPVKSPPSDLTVPDGHMAVHMRTALRLLKEAERAGGAAKLIGSLAEFGARYPDAYVTVPAILAAITLCPATTGTPSAAFVSADIAVVAGAVVISFTYTRTDGVGCTVKDISEVSITNTTTGTGAQKMSLGAVAQFENLKIPATNPPQERWTGKQTTVGATGGAISVGDAVSISVTFPIHNTKYCHTCTPDPVVITTSVTVK